MRIGVGLGVSQTRRSSVEVGEPLPGEGTTDFSSAVNSGLLAALMEDV